MNSFKENFKKIHRGDIKTLLNIYWHNKPIYKSFYFWISVVLSIIALITPEIITISKKEFIELLATNAISVFPSILGFNLGGYILLISLNSSKILNDLTEPESNGNDYSFYQKMSSVFAFSIILQVFSVVFSLLLIIISKVGKSVVINYLTAEIINSFILIFLSFIISYSTLLIIQIVLNIFNYGQVLHFFIRIDKLEKEALQNGKNS